MTMSQTPSSTVDSLPKQFVSAMRTLFDIMDDTHTGFVNFADIENRWQDDGTKGVPKGVIESLQKVTPPNGLLSFERFCAGLKICLLRNQVESRPNGNGHMTSTSQRASDAGLSQPNRPPSAPLLDIDCTTANKPLWSNTAAVRPNNAMPQHRALSMPQLVTERAKDGGGTHDERDNGLDAPGVYSVGAMKPVSSVNKQMLGPPKPPRSAPGLELRVVPSVDRNMDRAEIRTALQNWQKGLMMNDQDNKNAAADKRLVGYRSGRGTGDGKPAIPGDLQIGLYQKKVNTRRREPRRHTLQNGIDYNMLKRMKQIEQEKDVLMQGLTAIEKTRDWYLKQIAKVQEKMKYLGKMGSHMEHWTEAQQERLELQRARVLEVNRHLATLTDSWERGGLPLHMNLAVHHTIPAHNQELLSRLKQQNHLLTEEVSKKSERITILEKEKAALIRELLQTRTGQGRPTNIGQEESVF